MHNINHIILLLLLNLDTGYTNLDVGKVRFRGN